MAAPVTPRTLGSCPKRIDENEVLEAGVNYNCEFDRSFLTPGSRNTMQPRKVRDGAPPLEASPGSTIPDAALEDSQKTLAGDAEEQGKHEEMAGDDQSNEPASNELETENEEVNENEEVKETPPVNEKDGEIADDDEAERERAPSPERFPAATEALAGDEDSDDSGWGTHLQPGPARRASWAATQTLFSLAPDHGVDGARAAEQAAQVPTEQVIDSRAGLDGVDGRDGPLVVGYMGRDGVDGRLRRRHIVRAQPTEQEGPRAFPQLASASASAPASQGPLPGFSGGGVSVFGQTLGEPTQPTEQDEARASKRTRTARPMSRTVPPKEE